MKYEIIDEYGFDDYLYLYNLLDYLVKRFKIKSIFSIILIDDRKMKDLNFKYRNVDSTTDVLSFALTENKSIISPIKILGDIYISIPKMKEQAKEYEHSEKRELSFLVVHGFLHLLGYDHKNIEEENVMFKLQEEILNENGITK